MSDTFRTLDLDALFALNLPEREDIVDMMLPRSSMTLMAAREKGGKGLLAIDLLASIAAEEPFLDRFVRGGRVGYFPLEEHVALVRDRVSARIGNRRDIPFVIVPLNGIALPGDEPDRIPDRLRLDDAESMQKLYNTITENELEVVVIDVLREAHFADENNADEMAPLLRPVRQIAHETGVAIIINHHMNRQNTHRGSTAILAACDQQWALIGTDSDDDDQSLSGTLTVKGRYYPKQVIRVELGHDMRWRVATAVPEPTDGTVRGRILTFLDATNQWQTADDIAVALRSQVAVRTIQNTLSEMKKEVPCPFATRGRGGKCERFQYSSLQHRLDFDSPRTEFIGEWEGGNIVQRTPPDDAEAVDRHTSFPYVDDSPSVERHPYSFGGNDENDVELALAAKCALCGFPLNDDRRYVCKECEW